MSERFKNSPEKGDKGYFVVLGGLVIVMGGAIGITGYALHTSSPENQYERTFLEDNACLARTPFDTTEAVSEPAHYDYPQSMTNEDGLETEDGLLIVPQAPNAYSPAILSFVVDYQGLFVQPTLIPGDPATSQFLLENDC